MAAGSRIADPGEVSILGAAVPQQAPASVGADGGAVPGANAGACSAAWEPADPGLRPFLQRARQVADKELYWEIERAEDKIKAHQAARLDVEVTLRSEIESQSGKLGELACRTEQAQEEVSQSRIALDRLREQRSGEYQAARRRLTCLSQAAEVAQKMTTQAVQFQKQVGGIRAEHQELLQELSTAKGTWESASEALRAAAARVEQLEKEKAACEDSRTDSEKVNPEVFAEAKMLLSEQQCLNSELDELAKAHELSVLTNQEKRSSEDRLWSRSQLIEDVSSLEQEGDEVERNCQQVILQWRLRLETIVLRLHELEASHRQSKEWLQALWQGQCQQRRVELALHNKLQRGDESTEHYQKRTDVLIEALRQLEWDSRSLRSDSDSKEKLKQALAQAVDEHERLLRLPQRKGARAVPQRDPASPLSAGRRA